MIAEDQSDVDVVCELISKIARKKFAIRRVLGYGCGRMHSKARAWATQLQRQGCSTLLLVCDLDFRPHADLLESLTAAINPCPILRYAVVIPVREIEAWLLADHEAITQALKLKLAVKKQANPEAIPNPKERLRDVIRERSKGKVTYLNTVHNRRIAAKLRIPEVRRCQSFQPFEEFILKNLS